LLIADHAAKAGTNTSGAGETWTGPGATPRWLVAATKEPAITTLAKAQVHALMIPAHSLFFGAHRQISAQALNLHLPTIWTMREMIMEGGLVSYGVDESESFRQAGYYVIKFSKEPHLPICPLLGGAAAWPLAARAQQPTMPLVGFLYAGTAQAVGRHLASFRDGVRRLGYASPDEYSGLFASHPLQVGARRNQL
jgi:hypothetical protein